ncbi:MAG: PilZ domain-containing protein [Gammaproteobacteria bacterium]|nr:PilZ domain-containing protein [Gammaproteobacteria bacterium]
MTDSENRRHFTRVPFDADITLSHEGGSWPAHMLDISLHGLLVETPNKWDASSGDKVNIELVLERDVIINLDGHIAHEDEQYIGISIDIMELESASHLKRLLELNLGEPAMERELHELISIHTTSAPAHP